jgi:hypothetical protein
MKVFSNSILITDALASSTGSSGGNTNNNNNNNGGNTQIVTVGKSSADNLFYGTRASRLLVVRIFPLAF